MTWEEVDRDVFSRFAQFLYTGAYMNSRLANASSALTSKTPLENIVDHAKIWALADKYAVHPLKDLSFSHLAHDLAQWTVPAPTFFSDFGSLVRFVYGIRTIGGHELRRLVVQFAAHIIKDVSALDGWQALLEVPGFAVDLIDELASPE